MTARINCPICDWHHDVPPMDPRATDPNTLASVFGFGVMAAVAANRQAEETERELRKHLETHSLVEWVRHSTKLNEQLAEATRKAREIHGLCKRGTAVDHGLQGNLDCIRYHLIREPDPIL